MSLVTITHLSPDPARYFDQEFDKSYEFGPNRLMNDWPINIFFWTSFMKPDFRIGLIKNELTNRNATLSFVSPAVSGAYMNMLSMWIVDF